jgi:hypothetical protein
LMYFVSGYRAGIGYRNGNKQFSSWKHWDILIKDNFYLTTFSKIYYYNISKYEYILKWRKTNGH